MNLANYGMIIKIIAKELISQEAALIQFAMD
jgi:hypothetical protein